jgi:hypothetical protein
MVEKQTQINEPVLKLLRKIMNYASKIKNCEVEIFTKFD